MHAPTKLPAIAVRDLTCHFSTKRAQTTALADVSLSIQPGEFISIVGPSGCGKSTLLKIIAGLVRPTVGSVELLGTQVDGPQRDVGFAFQRSALLEWRGVRKNILLQAEIRGMDRAQAERRADYLIEMTGLRGFEDALPHELSGGMQQRAALCRALLHEPPVLLMDEPFGALDALTRETMNIELNRIWRETGVTVVLVTHSIAEAIYLGTRIEVMSPRPGRIVRTLPVELPRERAYGATLATDVFHGLAAEIRDLLGASSAHD
ncbi:ABC transporter ATP-binding protein [Streptomyces sp. NBC_00250]|uniref:ABC transporter ATP-binding protein n=1 Tax=Streptomyces sp. NBC_00250 TaxID=2903641 RepID=UPI002E2A889D|nr:ABC transporter ATP-binding protein [Streptomyces sp. NBC_00250]